MRSLSLLLAALVLAGCATTTGKLRARFAKEHACTEDETRVVESGGNAYRASGCGQSVEYVCPSFASMDKDARGCEERGLTTKKPGAEPRQMPGPNAPPDPPGHMK